MRASGKRMRHIELVVLLTVFFVCCSPPEPIRVGFVAGTSGRVADLGISGLDAVQLAIERCNREGGIDGQSLQLVIKDDQQDPAVARQAVRELVDQGVVAIIGPMTSAMAIAIAPLLDEARIPNMSPTVTTQELSGRDDFFLRVSTTTHTYASKSARYHAKKGDMRRVAAVYDRGNRSYCESWLNNFTDTFVSEGGSVVAAIGYETTPGKTFLSITQKLLESKPDGILIIANSMDSALFCQQIRKIDSHIPIALADWGATERLLELGGTAVEGVTVIQVFDRNSPALDYQVFRKDYIERYQREPGFPGVFSYDAARVIIAALRARKNGQNLKQTILDLKRFKGLQEDFSFDRFGDVERSGASISIVKDQQFVVVD